MTQLAIDFDAPPFQSHSATSRAASERIAPHVSRMQAAVLEWLAANGPATDNEIIAAGVVSANGTRARRVELVRKGLIVKAGERDGSTTWRVK